MRVVEIQGYLRSLDCGWVDRDSTVDTFIAGDPSTEVRGIAVGWMSYRNALEDALDLGCNVFITHEPTYFNHRDELSPDGAPAYVRTSIEEKHQFIEQSDLVILRCHDLWDQFPEIGIPDSWGETLGFEDPINGDGYHRIFDVSGRTASDVATRVAERTRDFGQEAVQLFGAADTPVSRLAIGTGANTPFSRLVDEYDADIVVCSDDGFTYWRDGALAIDTGVPAVVVNHAVSELPGMKRLAEHLDEVYSGIPVHHIEQSCLFRLVESDQRGKTHWQ